MRKIILPLMLILPCLSFAISQLEVNHAMCRDMHINSKTSLNDVKDSCRISEEGISSKGVYEVTLRNDTTNRDIICSFPDQAPSAILSGCR